MGKCIKHPKGGERKGGQGAERGERKEKGGGRGGGRMCINCEVDSEGRESGYAQGWYRSPLALKFPSRFLAAAPPPVV